MCLHRVVSRAPWGRAIRYWTTLGPSSGSSWLQELKGYQAALPTSEVPGFTSAMKSGGSEFIHLLTWYRLQRPYSHTQKTVFDHGSSGQ